MKLFISWSGERSKELAHALRDWLPLVLHYVEPWLSEADVAAGERWAQEVAQELEASNFGILCVTPENVESPWVLFEAGALAKSMQGAKVIPLLYNLEFSDITGPMAQFQAKKVEKAGLGEVIQSINQAADEAIPEERSKQLFTALWPEFEKMLESIPKEAPSAKHTRPQHEILEELVTGVRGLEARLREFESEISDQTLRAPRRRLRRFHPRAIDEMVHIVSDDRNDPIGLLLIGSVFREDLPWLHEILVEAYRDIKAGDLKAAQRASDRLRRVAKMMSSASLYEEFGVSSKDAQMLMMELPFILDHFLSRYLERLQESESEEIIVDMDKSGE